MHWVFKLWPAFLWQLDARLSKDSRPRASEVMYGLVYWHFYISLSLHVCDISLGTFWCAAHISNRCKKSPTHSSSGSHHSVTNYFLIYFVSRCRLLGGYAENSKHVWAIAPPPSITQPLNIHQSTLSECVATFFFLAAHFLPPPHSILW